MARWTLGLLTAIAALAGFVALRTTREPATVAAGSMAAPLVAPEQGELIPAPATSREESSGHERSSGESRAKRPRRSRQTLGLITGTVETVHGAVVPGARIELHGEDQPFEASTRSDAAGCFEFASLVPNRYRVVLDPEGLPDGLMPPYRQTECRYENGEPIVHAPCLEIEGSEGRTLKVIAYPPSSVVGRVLGPAGRPAANAFVRIMGGGIYLDTRTDEAGRFAYDSVYPREYHIKIGPAREHELYRFPRPKRFSFRVLVADALTLPDIFFRAGPKTIRGRVVDQDENPIENIAVFCYERERSPYQPMVIAGTDANGHFEFANLPAVDVGVTAGLEGYTGYRDVPLLEWAERLEVELGSGPDLIVLPPLQLQVAPND